MSIGQEFVHAHLLATTINNDSEPEPLHRSSEFVFCDVGPIVRACGEANMPRASAGVMALLQVP
jgi:hypothetical protein